MSCFYTAWICEMHVCKSLQVMPRYNNDSKMQWTRTLKYQEMNQSQTKNVIITFTLTRRWGSVTKEVVVSRLTAQPTTVRCTHEGCQIFQAFCLQPLDQVVLEFSSWCTYTITEICASFTKVFIYKMWRKNTKGNWLVQVLLENGR